MKQQKPYLIVCLAIVSLSFFAINAVAGAPLTRVTGYIWMITVLFLLFGIVVSVLYLIKKSKKNYQINLIALSIFLILNVILLKDVVALEYARYRIAQIEKIDTCEKAQMQFNKDLKNGQLQYFTFGLGEDVDYTTTLENKFSLTVYHMGCMADHSLLCYDSLVENHFGDKFRLANESD